MLRAIRPEQFLRGNLMPGPSKIATLSRKDATGLDEAADISPALFRQALAERCRLDLTHLRDRDVPDFEAGGAVGGVLGIALNVCGHVVDGCSPERDKSALGPLLLLPLF